MPQTFPAEQRSQLLQQLTNSLNNLTLQDLRTIAYTWGWPVRGSAKAIVVEQLVGNLSAAEQMAAGFRGLPEIQQEALIWLRGSLGKGEITASLATALRIGSGLVAANEDATLAIGGLHNRGLLIFDPYRGYYVPEIYGEWLPPATAAGLVYEGRAVAEPAVGAGRLNERAEHLLTSVAADKPRLAARPAPTAPAPARSTAAVIQATLRSRTGLVPEEILHKWGHSAPEDLAMARTLLDVMLGGGLLSLTDHLLGGKRVEMNAKALTTWREQSPAEHQQVLTGWWLGAWQHLNPQSPLVEWGWNELDMALQESTSYVSAKPSYTHSALSCELRQTIAWLTRDQLDREVGALRTWLVSLVQRLRPDTWFSFHRFCGLIYHLQRDLLLWQQYYPAWQWFDGNTPLVAAKMNLETWLDTYGRFIAVWLDGPARWLGLVQVATEGERIIAFQRPSEIVERSEMQLPADTLRFSGEDTLILRNIWQAGELRQIVKLIAAEGGRSRDATTYRLDPTAFRDALRNGRSAEQIARAFADANFPLPQTLSARLAEWQARAGRHQIYDNLAVIEFGNDEVLQEIQSAVNLDRYQVYPVSPRCLVLLDPATVGPLVDELRKKGYTPQVVS